MSNRTRPAQRKQGHSIKRVTRTALLGQVKTLNRELETVERILQSTVAHLDLRVFVLERLLREKCGVTEADVDRILTESMPQESTDPHPVPAGKDTADVIPLTQPG